MSSLERRARATAVPPHDVHIISASAGDLVLINAEGAPRFSGQDGVKTQVSDLKQR